MNLENLVRLANRVNQGKVVPLVQLVRLVTQVNLVTMDQLVLLVKRVKPVQVVLSVHEARQELLLRSKNISWKCSMKLFQSKYLFR